MKSKAFDTLFLLSVLLLWALVAGSCTKKPRIDIALSQCSGGDWRQEMIEEMNREILFNDNFDIQLDIANADDNVQQQIADLRRLAARKPDVLLVAPAVADSLVEVISEIQRSGVPVVVFDRDVPGADYTAFIGADNREVGRQAARYARTAIAGPIKALQITGDMNSTPARERYEGFMSMADSLPDFEIAATRSALWRAEVSRKVADSALSSHPEVNLIFCHNDPMAALAADAADAVGRRNKILLVDVDGSPYGLDLLVNGKTDVSILYPTLGHEIMRLALDVAQGQKVQRRNIITDLPAIDRSNVALFLTHNRTLRNETEKIVDVKSTYDHVYRQHNTQRMLLWALVVILLLLTVLLFYILRSYRERKRLHAELEKASRAKVNFFTNVSHDLRTPLTLIGTAIDKVNREAPLDPANSSLMRLALKNSRILTRLINQILDFNKYENEQLVLRLSDTGIHDFVDEMRLLFGPAAETRDIRFEVRNRIPKELRCSIDVEKVERILFNIISNALKFTPANGSIKLDASVSDDGSMLHFTVSDSGKGMDADELRGLFERNVHTREANPYGSGIGMSIAQAFVKLHGGNISAESVRGKGTSISFTMPVRQSGSSGETDIIRLDSEAVAEELNDIEMSAGNACDDEKLILVIDDNADIRALLTSILSPEYRVLRAASGSQGIKMASRFIPDAIICDIMMPDIDGNEVCRRLKNEAATSHIPVIMLTACARGHKEAESYRSGADGYLDKPFSEETLTAMLAAIFDNRRRISQGKRDTIDRTDNPGASSDVLSANTDIDDRFYQSFLKTVKDNMANARLSVDDVARAMQMERTQLYRKIKATTNYSPSELVRIIRLKFARQLLTTSDMAVKDVAARSGFASHAYFTKCYRSYYGETPGDSQRKTSRIQ